MQVWKIENYIPMVSSDATLKFAREDNYYDSLEWIKTNSEIQTALSDYRRARSDIDTPDESKKEIKNTLDDLIARANSEEKTDMDEKRDATNAFGKSVSFRFKQFWCDLRPLLFKNFWRELRPLLLLFVSYDSIPEIVCKNFSKDFEIFVLMRDSDKIYQVVHTNNPNFVNMLYPTMNQLLCSVCRPGLERMLVLSGFGHGASDVLYLASRLPDICDAIVVSNPVYLCTNTLKIPVFISHGTENEYWYKMKHSEKLDKLVNRTEVSFSGKSMITEEVLKTAVDWIKQINSKEDFMIKSRNMLSFIKLSLERE